VENLTPRATGTCPNGAVPKQGELNTQLALNLGGVLTGIEEFANKHWVLAAVSTIFARYNIVDICNANPIDPGPPTIDVLKASVTAQGFINATAPIGTIERYLWDHCIYWYFTQHCECSDQAPIPPCTQMPSTVAGAQPFPTDYASQPQLSRVEAKINASSDGLNTLYLGLQDTNQYVADLWLRSVQNVLSHTAAGQWSMSGEGYHDLSDDPAQPGTGEIDRLGIIVQLTQIPSTVARRGTTVQRLYGVGSVEWDASPVNFPFRHLITQRDALHYDNQWLLAPQWVQTNRVYWRLTPGVQAIAYEVPRSAGNAIYPSSGSHASAWTEFSPIQPPPNWSDSPVYPVPATRRVYALGSPP
jgi:hypothetical protein